MLTPSLFAGIVVPRRWAVYVLPNPGCEDYRPAISEVTTGVNTEAGTGRERDATVHDLD